jgi:hypothetical protein
VPPNAQELTRKAGAEVTACEPEALADAVTHAFSSPVAWRDRRELALDYARRFDWSVLLGDLLVELGLEVSAPSPGQAADESGEVGDLARDDGGRLEETDG